MADESNNNVIVSRIQHRRGLKQDLPQPLRPGEIGLATDSRQVYIGGDPENPQSAPYNAISYFENTIGAKDHTESIANNQIIAFQVPFIKYARGDYNGIATTKAWQPIDARSVIDGGAQPACQYSSSTYPVFSSIDTDYIDTTIVVSGGAQTGTTIVVNTTGTDATGNIRIGDRVTGDQIVGSNVSVTSVRPYAANKSEVTLTTQQTVTNNANITFIPQTILNYNYYEPTANTTYAGLQTKFNKAKFKSTDISVHKNGIRLVPESNTAILDYPSAVADYVINGSNVSSSGQQSLTLRTTPTIKDEVTVCYYSNANVIAALEGIESTGKIAPSLNVNSFYTEYNIPAWRQIPRENVRISETTGVGFIGLQQKHITSYVDGNVIADTNNLTLGNLHIARNDDKRSIDSITINRQGSSSELGLVSAVFDIGAESDIFQPVTESGNIDLTYRYNRAQFTNSNSGTPNYLYNKMFDVSATSDTSISVNIPETDYVITRPGSAVLAEATDNGYSNDANAQSTIITITGVADGIARDDWVRIVDATGTPADCELHGTVFQVVAVTDNSFNVRLDSIFAGNTTPDFTADIAEIYYINHGNQANIVNSTYQLYSENHGLTITEANIIVTEKQSVNDLQVDTEYSVSLANQSNTFFVDAPVATDDEIATGFSGKWTPELSVPTGIAVTPVLSINLSANTSVSEVVATVNKSLVQVEPAGANVQIFPYIDYLPESNNQALYLTQRPAYSSVEVGGLEFTLFEDRNTPTLSELGLQSGAYTRENNTVKAKLERWMDSLVRNRDINLFSRVLLGGDSYAGITKDGLFSDYNLTIDKTFGELLFCSRAEAADFNYITNSAYSESVYDRAEDDRDGTRGLVNLKNNLEVQTREAATSGQKVTTFTSLENQLILQGDSAGDTVVALEASLYDSFIVEYSIAEDSGQINKYSRIGTMQVSARTDFTNSADAVILRDQFSSQWDVNHSDPIVEPKFGARLVNGQVQIFLESQYRDPSNPAPGDVITYSIGSNLRIKYIYKRWLSR